METKNRTTKLVVSVFILAGVLFFPLIGSAGNLEPSAPPTPTMKTLDEVEPRVPIQSLSGDASAEYIIIQRGSYYLTGDVSVTDVNKHGIRVDADNVTIDLMGYALAGPDEPNSTAYGISMNGRTNVEIRNGTIRHFGTYGIYEASGGAENHRIINVRSAFNGEGGIVLNGASHLVTRCTASGNGQSSTARVYGINTYEIGGRHIVTENVVCENGQSADGEVFGIRADIASTVSGNVVSDNGNYGKSDVWGIYASYGCILCDNAVAENGSQAQSTVYGIYAREGCRVSGNTVYRNGQGAENDFVYGIYAEPGCGVIGNVANRNGTYPAGTNGYGIYLVDECLVRENTARAGNGTDIHCAGTCTDAINLPPLP
jgi:hypothetical protein